jgi:hypothetical protein
MNTDKIDEERDFDIPDSGPAIERDFDIPGPESDINPLDYY